MRTVLITMIMLLTTSSIFAQNEVPKTIEEDGVTYTLVETLEELEAIYDLVFLSTVDIVGDNGDDEPQIVKVAALGLKPVGNYARCNNKVGECGKAAVAVNTEEGWVIEQAYWLGEEYDQESVSVNDLDNLQIYYAEGYGTIIR